MAKITMRAKDLDKLSARFKRMARELPLVVDKGLADAAADMLSDFDATTSTWNHSAKFTIKRVDGGYTITTDDSIWNMLNRGTQPHVIEPVNANMLVFSSAYTAKSKPGFIGSNDGGPHGDTVFATRVNHPGTHARWWDQAISVKWRTRTASYVRNQLKQGIEAIGL